MGALHRSPLSLDRPRLEKILFEHFYGGVRFGSTTVRVSHGSTAHTSFRLKDTKKGLVLEPALGAYMFHLAALVVAAVTAAAVYFIMSTVSIEAGTAPLTVVGVIMGPILLVLLSRAWKSRRLTRRVIRLVAEKMAEDGAVKKHSADRLTIET